VLIEMLSKNKRTKQTTCHCIVSSLKGKANKTPNKRGKGRTKRKDPTWSLIRGLDPL
jgi:hypothetical protein